VSLNLLKSPRSFYIVTLQHEVLPRLEYFQSSSSGQNNIITTEVAKIPVLCGNFNWTF